LNFYVNKFLFISIMWLYSVGKKVIKDTNNSTPSIKIFTVRGECGSFKDKINHVIQIFGDEIGHFGN